MKSVLSHSRSNITWFQPWTRPFIYFQRGSDKIWLDVLCIRIQAIFNMMLNFSDTKTSSSGNTGLQLNKNVSEGFPGVRGSIPSQHHPAKQDIQALELCYVKMIILKKIPWNRKLEKEEKELKYRKWGRFQTHYPTTKFTPSPVPTPPNRKRNHEYSCYQQQEESQTVFFFSVIHLACCFLNWNSHRCFQNDYCIFFLHSLLVPHFAWSVSSLLYGSQQHWKLALT